MIEINIGGEVRRLDFTRNGLFEYIEEASGSDPIEWFGRFEAKPGNGAYTVSASIKDMAVLIYAGLNSALDVEDKPNIPFERVRRWLRASKFKDFNKIAEAVFTALSELGQVSAGDSVGEAAPQQNGAT